MVSVPDGKGWKTETRNVGGPKVFNYRGEIDDALQSRAYPIELPRQDDARLVVSNFDLSNPTGRLRDRLRRLAVRKAVGWTKSAALEHMREDSFVRRLERLPATLARHRQTAAVLLLVADILGLDLDSEMSKATSAQADSDTESDELRGWLCEIYARWTGDPSMPDLQLTWTSLLGSVNERRKAAGYHVWPAKSSALKTALRELGFEDGKSIVRRNAGRVVIFDADARKRLGIEREPPTTNQTGSKEIVSPDPGDIFEGNPTRADLLGVGAQSRKAPILKFDETTVTLTDGTVEDRWTGKFLRRDTPP